MPNIDFYPFEELRELADKFKEAVEAGEETNEDPLDDVSAHFD